MSDELFCGHGLPTRAFCARCVDEGIMSEAAQLAAGCRPEDTRALRDHFAGLAMQGLLASPVVERTQPYCLSPESQVARRAYAIADAMLSAREPRQEKP